MIEQIQKEIKKALAKLQFFAIGEVKKIDLGNYVVQAEILTTGMMTNWLRIGAGFVGDGFGEVKAPSIGDEVFICFPDGDPSGQGVVVARLYGKDVPPSMIEDEVTIVTKSGMRLSIDDKNKEIKIHQTDHEIVIDETGIYVGNEGAKEPLVLGHKLLSYLSKMTVLCTSPGQKSSTPQPPPTKALLSGHYFTQK